MKHARKILPLLLILCLVVSATTISVFAESGDTPPPAEVAETIESTGETSAPIEAQPAEEPLPTEATEAPTTVNDIDKKDVIDKPWEITRPEIVYSNSKFSNGVNGVTLTYLSKDGVTKVCYCIEPGVPITNAGVNAGFTSNDEADAWKKLSYDQKSAIALILAYGYPTVSFNDISSSGVAQKYGATQLLIWEIIDGVRDPYTFRTSDMYCSYFSSTSYPTLYAVYNKIQADLLRHNCYPSFTTPRVDFIADHTYELSYDAATGKYICILKDTTADPNFQTLPDYNFTSNIEGLTITRTDNVTLRIECTQEAALSLPDEMTFSAIGKAVTADCDSTITVWEAAGTTDQKLVSSSGARDPVPVYFRLKAPASGTMTMAKTSSCGAVEGYRFKLWHESSGQLWYGTADSNGAIYQTDENGNSKGTYTFTGLLDGTYSVRELISLATDKTIIPDSWRITVSDVNGNITYDHTFTGDELTHFENGDVAVYRFTVSGLTIGGKMTMVINNAPTLQDLEIVKTSPDGKVDGIEFYIQDPDGNEVFRGKTDSMGKLTVKDLAVGETYTVTEVVPEGYRCENNAQTITIVIGTNVVQFRNIPLPSLKIVKQSPDGNVANISFNIYKGDAAYEKKTVWNTFKTGTDGTLQIDNLTEGVYWIEEVVPIGYADQEAQRIELTSSNTTDNPGTVTFVNIPLLSLQIVKQSPDGNVANISFNIYKGDAAYEKKTVWNTFKTGTDGTLQIDNLTEGVYWIEEVVPIGYADQEAQRIELTSSNTKDNPGVVTFVNEPNYVLQIVKKSEDGNIAGIFFNIYTSASNVTSGNIFKTVQTDESGIIFFSLARTGRFWIEEIVPEGYAPQEIQRITVSVNNTAKNPAVVTFTNIPLRGNISIHKVDIAGQPLAGATFLLEYSLDGGTTWAPVRPTTDSDQGLGSCSSVSDEGTIISGADGMVLFSDLHIYSIQYRITEVAAPPGYQLLAEPIVVPELTADKNKDFTASFDVVNVSLFQMPPTGAPGSMGSIVSIASILSIASIFGIFYLNKKEKMLRIKTQRQ